MNIAKEAQFGIEKDPAINGEASVYIEFKNGRKQVMRYYPNFDGLLDIMIIMRVVGMNNLTHEMPFDELKSCCNQILQAVWNKRGNVCK